MRLGIYIDTSQVEQAVRNLGEFPEIVNVWKLEARGMVAYQLALNTPRQKGRMVGSIVSEDLGDGFIVYHRAPYTLFVNRGTGLFGPLRRIIVPHTAKVLVFEKEGQTIFAAYTVGQPGQRFIEKTEEEISGPVMQLADRLMVETFNRGL